MQCCFANPEPYVDPDAYYEIKPECRDDVTVSRFKPQPGRTLSPRRWQASFSPDGHLDIVSVLKKIQVGGVHPKIKGEVWEFLLGCYDPNSTLEQRNQLRRSRRLEYERLKNKCKEMDKSVGSGVVITMPVITDDGRPVQVLNSNNNAESALDNNVGAESAVDAESALDAESAVEKNGGAESAVEDEPVVVDKDVVQWKLSLHQIGLDVVRTDRSLVYYEDPLNRARLWDLLAVYSWIDGDIGYCQGMSDLCSPISILIENEADAFWCFERLMRRLRGNFKSTATSIGVRSQLTILANIIKAVDPKLHEHIENLDGGEYLFAFRMLMVLFRREFSFVDSLYLWELMWGMEYNPNMFALYESSPNILATSSSNSNSNSNSTSLNEYGRFEKRNIKRGPGGGAHHPPLSIFLVAGVLEAKSKRLLKETKGLDDVVKILNDITGNIDAKKACKEALKVHNKYLSKVKVS